ncbi:MAG: hypothetical protein ACM3U2_06800 [Deltaproteobacteria bacterium]
MVTPDDRWKCHKSRWSRLSQSVEMPHAAHSPVITGQRIFPTFPAFRIKVGGTSLDSKQWNYAAGRMTGAEVVALKIDETVAWQGEPLHNVPDSPHTGFVAPIEIPGISADGREVEE